MSMRTFSRCQERVAPLLPASSSACRTGPQSIIYMVLLPTRHDRGRQLLCTLIPHLPALCVTLPSLCFAGQCLAVSTALPHHST